MGKRRAPLAPWEERMADIRAGLDRIDATLARCGIVVEHAPPGATIEELFARIHASEERFAATMARWRAMQADDAVEPSD